MPVFEMTVSAPAVRAHPDVPLAVIAVIGIAFYFPDSKTRHEEIPESVMAAVAPVGDADRRP
jgi:hypothetical protein